MGGLANLIGTPRPPDLDELANLPMEVGYRARYGMGPVEFQRRAFSGEVPGSTPNPGGANEDIERRRAAAYFFARRFPRLAPVAQPLVNAIRSLVDEPEVIKAATAGSGAGVSDYLESLGEY